MTKKGLNIDKLSLLEVFQVCDSTFPIGTFNHSFGMENYLSDRRIKKAPEFEIWFKNYFDNQFKYSEGLLILLCMQALKTNDFEKICEYDKIITMSTLATETRNGTKLIAKQMIRLLKGMYGDIKMLVRYEEEIKKKKCFGSPAIVFSMFAFEKGIDVEDAFILYGYSIASTMVQNAVRAIPLGQMEGQVILHNIIERLFSVYEKIKDLDEEYLGASMIGIELAQIRHESQESRLFMS